MIDSFKETLEYPVDGKPKLVHYFLAELTDPNTEVILSDEHINFKWEDLEQTKALSAKADMNKLFDKADKIINSAKS